LTVLGDALEVLHRLPSGYAVGGFASAKWPARAAAGHCSICGYAATYCPHTAAGHAAAHGAPETSTAHTAAHATTHATAHTTTATAHAADEHESTAGSAKAGGRGTE